MIPREFFHDFAAEALPARPGLPFVRDELRNAAPQPLVRPYDMPERTAYRRRANRAVAAGMVARGVVVALAVAGALALALAGCQNPNAYNPHLLAEEIDHTIPGAP